MGIFNSVAELLKDTAKLSLDATLDTLDTLDGTSSDELRTISRIKKIVNQDIIGKDDEN